MTYKFQNKELKIGKKLLEFDNEIKEVIDFDGFLVVRTDYYEKNNTYYSLSSTIHFHPFWAKYNWKMV